MFSCIPRVTLFINVRPQLKQPPVHPSKNSECKLHPKKYDHDACTVCVIIILDGWI